MRKKCSVAISPFKKTEGREGECCQRQQRESGEVFFCEVFVLPALPFSRARRR